MRTVRNQPRTTREDLDNDLKAAWTIVNKKTIGNTLRCEGLKSCSARKVPLFKKVHVQARLKFPMIQRRTGWMCCGQMRPKSSSLASTQLIVFGVGGMLPMTPRTPMDGAMSRQGQGIENGSWMGIPAWQWPKTHGQGNKEVAQEEAH